MKRWVIPVVVGLWSLGVAAAAPASSSVRVYENWATYLYDNQHSSYNAAATAVTPSTAPGLTLKWAFRARNVKGRPPARLYASPTVVSGAIYVGSNTGMFYKLRESTGKVVWKADLGFAPKAVAKPSCRAKGTLATAAVAPDPVTGTTMVYVASGDGNVYALQASDGTVAWKSPVNVPTPGTTDHYNFSSPLIADGHVYEGISSSCDKPLIRGGLAELDQLTGDRLATYYTVPDGSIGGSVWSSPAITPDGSTIYITTGNGDPTPGAAQGDSVSIVALNADTLATQDIWTVPVAADADSDFGGSPTLFTASIDGTPTPLVGALNKDGTYDAWRQGDLAAGPVWSTQYGGLYEVSAAAWDGHHLFVAGGSVVIDGVSYAGSVAELDPSTGDIVWQTGVSAAGLGFGSPTLDGGGLLAVPTYDTATPAANVSYLVDTATGGVVRTFALTSPTFSQTVFADSLLLVTDGGQKAATLYAYG